MLQLGKTDTKRKGTGKTNCLSKLGEFYDLHNIGSVKADMIDFSVILQEAMSARLLIFDPDKTPGHEATLKAKMPPLFRLFVEQLESIGFKDPIPTAIQAVLRTESTPAAAARRARLREALNTGEHYVLATDAQLQSMSGEADSDNDGH